MSDDQWEKVRCLWGPSDGAYEGTGHVCTVIGRRLSDKVMFYEQTLIEEDYDVPEVKQAAEENTWNFLKYNWTDAPPLPHGMSLGNYHQSEEYRAYVKRIGSTTSTAK